MEETIMIGTGAIDLMNKEKKYLEAKVESLERIIKAKDSLAESFKKRQTK